jgi:hypothetical protein
MEFKISNRMIFELSNILSREKNIKHINFSYDLANRKKTWKYETNKDEENN